MSRGGGGRASAGVASRSRYLTTTPERKAAGQRPNLGCRLSSGAGAAGAAGAVEARGSWGSRPGSRCAGHPTTARGSSRRSLQWRRARARCALEEHRWVGLDGSEQTRDAVMVSRSKWCWRQRRGHGRCVCPEVQGVQKVASGSPWK